MQRSFNYFIFGRPLAPLYSLAMTIRERCYQRGWFKSHRLAVPVLSVGNLTMGGTGKTPVVQYIARLLQKNGYRPAIISRGYGGCAKEPVNLVSDGDSLLLSAEFAGDESRFLAETLPGVPVLTGIVRHLPAREAIAMGAEVLILDDGFQHMQLKRDLNLVLFNSDTLAGNSRVFPGGDLREPVKALRRAGAFVMTGVRADNRQRAERFQELLAARFPGKAAGYAAYQPAGFSRLADSGVLEEVDPGQALERKWFAFCGIAHPESFHATLQRQNFDLAGFSAFADHVGYSDKRLARMAGQVVDSGAEQLITTEKDLVKLGAVSLPLPVYALRMEVCFDPGFDELILDAVS
ncbi:tetraacyldisaccharide 4'-kinase [Desulfogranum mediterraneum]|uniref:tetraacyldisaccharide 4'-kinase n=1 Tax=Desulfogranum mediterraneum TaxID=160661 RepID=UPI00040AA9CA|nr:tetraacyldisaccharide 4'-kinase [Desulfogranum mediterraneum]